MGPDPHEGGATTPALNNCPDFWELEDGDFAIIGIDLTSEVEGRLPQTASCGPDEKVVRVPRRIILDAREDLSRMA